MFEDVASEDPAGFLAAVGEALAKLPSELWRTGNEGFGAIVAAMDAVGVQLENMRPPVARLSSTSSGPS